MRRYLRFSFLLIIICSLLVFTGCSSSSSKSDGSGSKETKTIEFMTISLSPAFDSYIKNVITQFEKKNPGVKVKWSDEPYDQIEQLVLTKASSGNLPDVMNLNTDLIKTMGGLGALVDMDKAAADVKDDFFSGLWKSGKVNGGATYALPWYISTSGLLYNKDLLAKAGIDTIPTTFKEAWKDSEIIKKKTGAYGMVLEHDGMHILLPKEGVNIISDDGTKATLNTPKALELWTFLKQEYDKGIIPKDVLLGQAQIPELYAQQKVAFWATGPQLFRQVQKLSPDVYSHSDAAPALFGDAHIQKASIMNIAVAKSSKNKDLAVKFAEFITNDANQLEFSKEAHTLPSVKGAANSDYFNQGKDSTDPAVKGTYFGAQQLESAVDLTVPSKNASAISKEVEAEFNKVLLENKDPKKALEDAEKTINGLLQDK